MKTPSFDAAVQNYKASRGTASFVTPSSADDIGFFSGLKGSSLGQLLGYAPTETPEDTPMTNTLMQGLGGFVGDIPAMLAGGAIGGPILGTAGAFAIPELIKQAAQYIRSEPSDTTAEALGKILNIPLETGKSALVGAATGGLGHAARFGKAFGPGSKVTSNALRELIGTGAEIAGMTGAESVLEGRMPTLRQIAENAILVGGLKGISPAIKGIRKPLAKKFPMLREGALKKAALDQAMKIKPVQELMSRYEKSKPFFEMTRKNVGEANATIIENQLKWKKSLKNLKESPTPEQLEAAIYYMQKTGNPNIKGDSFEHNAKRVGAPLREILDNEIRPHFERTLQEVNRQAYARKINRREILKDMYAPGMYENAEKFPEVDRQVSGDLKNYNPFANMKKFLTYHEALVKGGLKPRYKNIFDLVDAYDQIFAKNMAGAQLLSDIAHHEKANGEKLILTSRDPEYKYAKGKYVPYQDLTLRSYTNEGKLGRPTVEPALVAPELSDAIQGVFSKEAYKPTNKFVKALRTASDLYRLGRVRLSFFHYVPLTESSAGALGFRKALNFKDLARKGYELRNDPAFMKDAVKHGLIIHKPVERYARAMETSSKLNDMAEKAFPSLTKALKSKYNIPSTALKKLANAQKYMFEQYHPNLKAVTWQDFVGRATERAAKEGKTLTESQMYKLKTDMADLVNNMYGGQNWAIQRVFNSKKYRDWLRDVIAYPDWTTSAIKQAANAFAPGLKGQVSRKYWMQFGLNYLLAHGLLKFMAGSIQKTDKGWDIDPKKGWKELSDPDPLSWYKFPLPNIEMNIGGFKFNPGRDERGRRLYSHFGKQALEIKDWIYHPFSTYFGKANPLVQEAYKQLTGYTPGKEQQYAVRGKPKGGRFEPWDATRPGTSARLASRGLALAESMVPFSMRSAVQHGGTSFLATGGSAVPISLGSTPNKAQPVLEEAFRNKDYKLVTRIKQALRENNYTGQQINRVVNAARRNAAKK